MDLLKSLNGKYKEIKDKPDFCNNVISFLIENKDKILKSKLTKTINGLALLSEPYFYKDSNLLHILASEPPDSFSCNAVSIDCSIFSKIIDCLINKIHEVTNVPDEKWDEFLIDMNSIINNENSNNETALNIAEKRKQPEVREKLRKIFEAIASKKTEQPNTPDVVSPEEIEIFTKEPSFVKSSTPNTKNNEELGKLITTILNGFKKTTNSETPIKGGAQDDGLARFIVRVLKSINENSKENTKVNQSTQASRFGSISKKDELDSLLSDLIDIILNIANNEPLPITMKDKLLSGIGKFSGIFKGIAPEEDTGVFVPVNSMGCNIGKDSNPIAKMDNECIDDKMDK